MSLVPTKRKAESSLDRAPSNDTTHTDGRDSVTLPDETESPVTDTLDVASQPYIYYQIYAEDGAIPSKTPATPSDPFIGRIIARSVPFPHIAKAVKHTIARVEDIKDGTSISLFLTPYSKSPLSDAGEVTILNRTGPGSTPQEPLALVANMSDSERSALESGRRAGLASVAEPDTTPPEFRYLYYLLYANDYEMPSKVAIDPDMPSLGRIRADSVAPPHSPATIKRCISKVERTPALVHANLFAGISCKTPLYERHISILRTDGPGLSPNEPMAIVQRPLIPDWKYVIKNRTADISRVERTPALVHANLFAGISCKTQLNEGHISVLRTDGPGLSQNEPMAIVQHTDGADSPSVLSGRDPVDETESSFTDTLSVATRRYIYYRIYAEDGAIPSKTPATPSDPFIGRIKAISVPPPHTLKAVKGSIAKVEDIKDCIGTNLFLTPYSQLPMGDVGKVSLLNRAGLGSTPQEPLALVAKMSDSERTALESGRRGVLTSAAEPNTTPQEFRYLYYLLYVDEYEISSKVAFDLEVPSLGRIRADSVAPPHSLASIKRCISRVERTPALAGADLFADISCNTPLKKVDISTLRTDGPDGPGLSPNDPMAIVQKVQSISDGRYVIKNRAADIFWCTRGYPINTIFFWSSIVKARADKDAQFHVTQDTNGNISMTPLYHRSSWVGAEFKESMVPVPWRLIPAAWDSDSIFYYLTTDMNCVSQNPRVPAARRSTDEAPGPMATLEEGDQWQMWEFIRI